MAGLGWEGRRKEADEESRKSARTESVGDAKAGSLSSSSQMIHRRHGERGASRGRERRDQGRISSGELERKGE